jgi:hypothetical protein
MDCDAGRLVDDCRGRRLAPRGGRTEPEEEEGKAIGIKGGLGRLCHCTVSPGSRLILLIWLTSALPPIVLGGVMSTSCGRGDVAGDEPAEKGEGYRSGGKVDS